jgi:hypothetical protein
MGERKMSALTLVGVIAFSSPFLAIALTLAAGRIRHAVRMRKGQREGAVPVPRGSIISTGTAMLHLQVFYQPSIVHVLEAEEDEDVDEDDSGEPETPLAHFHRQLRRIRRGEGVETLVLRL